MHFIDISVVAIFLFYTVVVGLRKTPEKQSSRTSYLLAGRTLTLPAFVATTVSTWYGGILGVGEYGYRYGISNWIVFGLPYYIAALIFAFFVAQRARKSDALTLPHLLSENYGAAVGKMASAVVMLTTIPAAYFLIVGALLHFVFGIPVALACALCGIYTVIYLWRGGFYSVVRTDALQIIFMFGAFGILSAFLLIGQGTEVLDTLPSTHFEPTGGRSVFAVAVWYFIALSTLTEPNFYQRCFAVKSPVIAKKGLLISVVCWIIFDMMTTLCALYARALFPALDDPKYAFPVLAEHVLPVGILGLFFTGLFATVLSTSDSSLFTAATTFSVDLCKTPREKLKSHTRFGMILSAVIAVALAYFSESVISLWHLLGSLAGSVLLVPSVLALLRVRVPGKCVMTMMSSSLILTLADIVLKQISGAYWMGIEPIFIGLAVSTIFLVLFGVISGFTRHSKREIEAVSNDKV